MPLRFDKTERDERARSRQAAKPSHTCKACAEENCIDCQGTCDCSKCSGKGKGASTLDALESKTANLTPWLDDEPFGEYEDQVVEHGDHEGQCPGCGGPSKLLGQLGNRTHYRCENCGMDHSSESHHGKTAGPYGLGYQAPKEPSIFDQYDRPMNSGETPTGRVTDKCPYCDNPVVNGRCTNGYCVTNEGRGSHGAEGIWPEGGGRSEWSPEQVRARWEPKTADASTPPEGGYQQKETASPYNPAAFEGMVEDMHPAAKFTYERSVQQGAKPQEAIQAAQQKQQEMANRALQGQNVEGVQQTAVGDMGVQPVMAGFVSDSDIQRVSHLLS